MFNGCAVNDRLEHGTDLAGCQHLVILEILEIKSPDPYFYFSGLWFYGYHAGLKYLQVVFERINRGHLHFGFSLVCTVNSHGLFLIHGGEDGFLAKSLAFQIFICLAFPDSIIKEILLFVPWFLFSQVCVESVLQ